MIRSQKTLRRALSLGAATILASTGLALVAVVPAQAAVQTRYVATDGNDVLGESPNLCAVQATPCKTIGHAVDEAAAGDTVSIAKGTYAESVAVDKSLDFKGAGSTGADKTTVSGNDDDDPTFLVEDPEEGPSPTVTFTDLDISGGTIGIALEAGSVNVTDSVIDHNSGSGIFALAEDTADLTVTDSHLDHNGVSDFDSLDLSDFADGSGGITFVGEGSLKLSGDTIDGDGLFGVLAFATDGVSITDTSVTDSVGPGVILAGIPELPTTLTSSIKAAVKAAAATPPSYTISGSTLSDNGLGGLAVFAAAAKVDHTTIDGNTGFGYLGALANGTTITDSTISNSKPFVLPDSFEVPTQIKDIIEQVVDGEGVIDLIGTTNLEVPAVTGGTTLTDSTVADNSGQGVLDVLANTTLTHVTVSGTKHVTFTGLDDSDDLGLSQANLVNVDLTDIEQSFLGDLPIVPVNSAIKADLKAADAAPAPPVGTLTVNQSIVTGSASGSTDCAGIIVDGTYNLSGDTSCGFTAAQHSLAKGDAKLGALTANGGPTKTELLGLASQAQNAIPLGTADCAVGGADQRGVARPDSVNKQCDIGAVEMAELPVVIHPNSLPNGTVGKAYQVTLSATGGKGYGYVFSLAPGTTLPAGLTLSPAGVLSGTPTTKGTFSLTVSVDDPTLKTYTLTIVAAEEGTTTPPPPPLANTGTDTGAMIGSGTGLLGLGLVAMIGAGFVGRRRRGAHRAV